MVLLAGTTGTHPRPMELEHGGGGEPPPDMAMANVPGSVFYSEGLSFLCAGLLLLATHVIALLVHRADVPLAACASPGPGGAFLQLFIALYYARCLAAFAVCAALSRAWLDDAPRFLQPRAALRLLLGRRALGALALLSLVLGYVALLQAPAECRGSWLYGLTLGVLVLVHLETLCPLLCLVAVVGAVRCCLPLLLPEGPQRDQFMLQVLGQLPRGALEGGGGGGGGGGGPPPLTPAQLAALTRTRVIAAAAQPPPPTGASGASAAEAEGESCAICCGGFSAGESVRVLACGGGRGSVAATAAAAAAAAAPAALECAEQQQQQRDEHCFHDACVSPWLLQYRGSCPVCRTPLLQAAPPPPPPGAPPPATEATIAVVLAP